LGARRHRRLRGSPDHVSSLSRDRCALERCLAEAERSLARGGRAGPELTAIAEREIEATADIHAPAAYRKKVGAQLVNRVVEQAWS